MLFLMLGLLVLAIVGIILVVLSSMQFAKVPENAKTKWELTGLLGVMIVFIAAVVALVSVLP